MPFDQIQVRAIRENSHPVTGLDENYAPLFDLIGNSRFVLIGEASHGTHEFYRTRAYITKRLIREKGFRAVAVEADWPDAHRVNSYVLGRGQDRYALQSLDDFRRFPAWMWRNSDVLDFVNWLRDYNDSLPRETPKTAFYGMDLYSFHSSSRAVLDYLDKVDPEAARRARFRYGCFEQFGEDIQAYGYAATFGLSKACEDEVVVQLIEMSRRAADLASRDGRLDPDEFFTAEQNARVVKNAERYYRAMFSRRISSWNLRDRHMAETLDQLISHLGASAKIVVWAHNSHLGDARATEMSNQGELNVGQLVREKYGNRSVLIGFTTYTGAVTAASNWDGPAEQKQVRPALSDSFEAMFHATHVPAFLTVLRGNRFLSGILNQERLERAIGVVYLPHSERVSHYFHARLADQFDAVIHIDNTKALQPLEITSQPEEAGEVPETYPSAI
ncbi:MAG: erythromycin esterase [Acidobacteria bacterium]|nr:MAG: erythromycin esterase [Acidobacteriota bacterium]